MTTSLDNFVIDLKYIIYKSNIRFCYYFKSIINNEVEKLYESFKNINFETFLFKKFTQDLKYLIYREISKLNKKNKYLSNKSLTMIENFLKNLEIKENLIESYIFSVQNYINFAKSNTYDTFLKNISLDKVKYINKKFDKHFAKLNNMNIYAVNIFCKLSDI